MEGADVPGEAYEGQLYEQLLKLDALDRDGSETFSKICQFHLVTTDVPFTISSQGKNGNVN